MRFDAPRFALALVLLLLALAVAYSRFMVRGGAESSFEPELCVGVDHPEIGLGMVCTRDPSQVLSKAVQSHLLPPACADVSVPQHLSRGSSIVFRSGSGCAVERTALLPSELRLLAGGKFNVNRDAASDLLALPGIGEIKAQRIVESREAEGPFQNVFDLVRVHGIGEKTALRLESWLTWD